MAFDITLIIFLFFIGILIGLLGIMIGLKFPKKKKNLNNICDYCDNEYLMEYYKKILNKIPLLSFKAKYNTFKEYRNLKRAIKK